MDKTPKNDVLFKILFGDPEDTSLLIGFLNDIIYPESPIISIEVRPTELTAELLETKGVRLDILARTEFGEVINVELQKEDEKNMTLRTQYHWGRAFVDQIKRGGRYRDLKRTVCINILNSNLFKQDGDCWRTFKFLNTKTYERLDDAYEIHFLELTKLKDESLKDKIKNWLLFINDPNSDALKMIYEKDPLLKEGKMKYDRAIADSHTLELMRIREDALLNYKSEIYDAREEGLEKGREEGKDEKAIEVARALLQIGDSVEKIMQVTGLTEKDIKKLVG